MLTLILTPIAFAAGYLLRSWMLSKQTGRPLGDTLRGRGAGGPGEERATTAGAGGPGEEK